MTEIKNKPIDPFLKGFGGWLWVLTIGYCILPAIYGVYGAMEFINQAEQANPILTRYADWQQYRSLSLASSSTVFLVYLHLVFSLMKNRTPGTIKKAIYIIWICPIANVLFTAFLEVRYLNTDVKLTMMGMVAIVAVWAIGASIWTIYFKKSKRIKITYGY